jgi:hypothetical protein
MRQHPPFGRVGLSGPGRVLLPWIGIASEFASQNNFREIGKLFEHVKALSGPSPADLPTAYAAAICCRGFAAKNETQPVFSIVSRTHGDR